MHIRPATPNKASSLPLLTLEVWSTTYLCRGINGFFADYALEEFSKARFQALLHDPLEIVLAAKKIRCYTGMSVWF